MILCSDPTWRIGGVHWIACFFVLVISLTLLLEYFLSSSEALAEIDEVREALGFKVSPLYDDFFFSLLWE